ncbi:MULTISPECIES: phosphatase PAP2 family protein [Burkholderia]|uniref:phosphatase PAP2 family protein n=1 Tax=Burkholderia TaxID=32008 RepID=UPI001F06CD27|nr:MULTISPECIES: phosphatase PAP2 family protein [Burkholderia]
MANSASIVSHHDLLCNGQFRQFNRPESQGLVSLPSFHVMLALLLAHAMRHVRYVFPASVVLNAVMIMSTPTTDGHYLSDVIARIVACCRSSSCAAGWRGRAGPRIACRRAEQALRTSLTHRATLPVGLGDDQVATRVRRVRAGTGPPAGDDAVFEDA